MEIVAICRKQSLRSNSGCLLTLSNLLIEHKRESESMEQCSDVLVSRIAFIPLIINDNPTA